MSESNADTSVKIRKPTHRRLNTWKSMHGLTHDEAIQELLDRVDAPDVE